MKNTNNYQVIRRFDFVEDRVRLAKSAEMSLAQLIHRHADLETCSKVFTCLQELFDVSLGVINRPLACCV